MITTDDLKKKLAELSSKLQDLRTAIRKMKQECND